MEPETQARIGYACLAVGVPGTALHGVTSKNASPERLRAVTEQNLAALGRMLAYNAENGIRLFRVSSNLVPFGSSPVNTLRWQEEFGPEFARLGQTAARAGIRLSMHPGQYTVLNSPDEAVVRRAVADLRYHADVLRLLGMDDSCKIILHVGGVYGDRRAALERLSRNWTLLPEAVRRRVALENDERCYTIAEVLGLSRRLGVPAVFDNLHHALNPPADDPGPAFWVRECAVTWGPRDGRQKIHYSQQSPDGRPGAHSAAIDTAEFLGFFQSLYPPRPDVMLEVKDKNLSAVRCLDALGLRGGSGPARR